MLTCALPGIKFENLVYTTFMGVSHALQYLNELQVFKGARWKIILKDGKCGPSFPP